MRERIAGEIPTLETRSEANETVDKKKRYKQIIEILQGGKEMTAKEIAVEMCNRGYIPTSERNFTAPRLTELSKNGVVEPVGKQKCTYTGKTVCVYALLEKQTSIYDFL
jgi:repressor of nif and glnA expression